VFKEITLICPLETIVLQTLKAGAVNGFDLYFHSLKQHMKRAVAVGIEAGIYHELRVTNSEKTYTQIYQ